MIPAIKYRGKIVFREGTCHPVLVEDAIDSGEINDYLDAEEGFMHEGEFIDREAALDIAKKINDLNEDEVNQIIDANGEYGLESITFENIMITRNNRKEQ